MNDLNPGRGRPAAYFLPAICLVLSVALSACSIKDKTRHFPLRGQVLSVHTDRREITIKHEDVEGLMPGMTMTFPVSSDELLKGREPGELIYATLEMFGTNAWLIKIEHTGFSPLPTDSNAAEIAGNLLSAGDLLPDAAFIDQGDRRRSMSEWRGSMIVLTFIYTMPAPELLPADGSAFSDPAGRDRLGPGAPRKGEARDDVSFDPDFDTPAILAAHAKKLGADPEIWTFLTGDRATVDKFAARLGVGLIRPSGVPEITHNLRTALVGADGRILKIYSGNEWTPAKALEDVRAAVRVP